MYITVEHINNISQHITTSKVKSHIFSFKLSLSKYIKLSSFNIFYGYHQHLLSLDIMSYNNAYVQFKSYICKQGSPKVKCLPACLRQVKNCLVKQKISTNATIIFGYLFKIKFWKFGKPCYKNILNLFLGEYYISTND